MPSDPGVPVSRPTNSPIVGIDLGTTNSLVAFCDQRGPRVLVGERQGALVPSVVRYGGLIANPTTIVGAPARDAASQFPRTTIASVKRLMGRSRQDAAEDVKYLGYDVVEGDNNTARVTLPLDDGTLVVSPPEVSAVILRDLKLRASAVLGVEVRRAVVTVPAYFDDMQRQATRDAGRLAGLEVVRIVSEPTAAALAYGLGLESWRNPASARARVVAVYDLGGGTFDVSILRLTPANSTDGTQDPAFFQVLATAGDTHLGGDDVDHMIVELITGDSPAVPTPGERQSLKHAAEFAKCELSTLDSTTVRVNLGGRAIERVITRSELETLIDPWIERSLGACRRALKDAARREDASGPLVLDALVMVGGSTRIPLVRRRAGELFGLEPYTALDPDLVVALGASVQAAIMSGVVRGSLLLDVIPLSLGVETVGGAVAKIVMRNSTVPTRATEMFSTSVDNQTAIRLTIYQGEREMAGDCRSLGVFELRGLPPMPAGIPQVEVEFLVDANGVLNVSAVERRSGKRSALQVVPNHGLTREEVARMESDSFTHAREDMTRHRVVDLIVNSRLDLKWIGERYEKFKGLLEPDVCAVLEPAMSTLQKFIAAAEKDWKSVDPNTFAAAKSALDTASVRLQEIGIRESLKQG